MALVKAETLAAQAQGFSGLPPLRQVGLLVGLAAAIAIGVAMALWTKEPNYSLLYGGLSGRDASEVVEILQKSAIPYQVDQGTGAVMVPGTQVHEARMKLAAAGLPRGTGTGFEMLEKEQGFGTSQFIENARYQHALEGELSRTIGTLGGIQSARVHLALPKPSVFLRDRQKPSASVALNIYSGRTLDEGQVAAIVHLVASSVPNLEANQVTVVDQTGRLLTAGDGGRDLGLTDNQFKYTRRLEDTYNQRIYDLLAPLVGANGVRAQVVADLDFTMTEQTQELFKPEEKGVLRSEQTMEEQSAAGGLAGAGVPGALSNQPPEAGTLTPAASAPGTANSAEGATNAPAKQAMNSSRQATRNYEIDKTISHTKLQTGTIKRLSVAVVLDDKQSVDDEGETTRTPLTEEELTRYTTLVKEAVGFDEERGDSVNVINASFQPAPEPAPLPEPPIWEQAWLWDIVKKVIGGLGVLLLIFGVLKPILRGLAEKGASTQAAAQQQMMALAAAGGAGGEGGMRDDRVSLTGGGQAPQLPGPTDYDNHLNMAKGMVSQDPKLVAQVVKNWVGNDG